MNSRLETIKDYIFKILFLAIIGYGIFMLWLLYSQYYSPVILEQSTISAHSPYAIPEQRINKVLENITTKTEQHYDVENIPNPFTPPEITPLPDDTTSLDDTFGTPSTGE